MSFIVCLSFVRVSRELRSAVCVVCSVCVSVFARARACVCVHFVVCVCVCVCVCVVCVVCVLFPSSCNIN